MLPTIGGCYIESKISILCCDRVGDAQVGPVREKLSKEPRSIRPQDWMIARSSIARADNFHPLGGPLHHPNILTRRDLHLVPEVGGGRVEAAGASSPSTVQQPKTSLVFRVQLRSFGHMARRWTH